MYITLFTSSISYTYKFLNTLRNLTIFIRDKIFKESILRGNFVPYKVKNKYVFYFQFYQLFKFFKQMTVEVQYFVLEITRK